MSSSIDEAKQLLSNISQDNSVPRNIRKCAEDIILKLEKEDQSLPVRLNSCISLLDDMSNDPNVPAYVRPVMWRIAGLLEVPPEK